MAYFPSGDELAVGGHEEAHLIVAVGSRENGEGLAVDLLGAFGDLATFLATRLQEHVHVFAHTGHTHGITLFVESSLPDFHGPCLGVVAIGPSVGDVHMPHPVAVLAEVPERAERHPRLLIIVVLGLDHVHPFGAVAAVEGFLELGVGRAGPAVAGESDDGGDDDGRGSGRGQRTVQPGPHRSPAGLRRLGGQLPLNPLADGFFETGGGAEGPGRSDQFIADHRFVMCIGGHPDISCVFWQRCQASRNACRARKRAAVTAPSVIFRPPAICRTDRPSRYLSSSSSA